MWNLKKDLKKKLVYKTTDFKIKRMVTIGEWYKKG